MVSKFNQQGQRPEDSANKQAKLYDFDTWW